MIEIFPNLLDGGPCDTQKIKKRTTIAQWLDHYCKDGYTPGQYTPVKIKVEGEAIAESEWLSFIITPRDHVEVRVVPSGTDPFSITIALFAGVKAVFGMMMPKLPGTPKSPGQGDSLAQGSVRGNKVKLGQVIRESFGTQKIYPDYLVPPHKYFSEPRVQQSRFCMNIGVGSYQINADTVRIGDTSIIALGGEAEYRIYGEGESLAADPAAQWWHTAAEVGSSSTGAAGLELTASTSLTSNVVASSINYSGYTVNIPSGAGTFPADWTVGLTIRMIVPYTYTVTDGGGAVRDSITGPLSMLAPVVGQQIEVAGSNAGIYQIHSWAGGAMTLDFAGGAPANGLVTGSGSAAIGPVGLRFKILAISPSSMTVQRLDSSGSPDVSFPGFDNLTTSSSAISLDGSSLEGGWRGPFSACPPGELTSNLEIDVFFPEGLTGINKNGDFYLLTATYEVQYRDTSLGGAWTSITYSNTDATLDQIGYTQSIGLPYSMRPEVRMRKLSPLANNLEWHDTVQWYGLKALLDGRYVYPGCTTITGRIQTSDRISAQTESQINVVGTRLLPIRIGGVWQPKQPTRDIAPAAIYVAKSLGISDEGIDLIGFDALSDAFWTPRGDKFDMAIEDQKTAKDVLNDILGCGFSEMIIDSGLITPVRDGPRSMLEHSYSAQNMTQALSTDVTLKSDNDFDGVDVTYFDSTTWTEETVSCRLPGDPLTGRRIDKITAPGISSRAKAYQYGMRRRATHEWRRDSYSWSTPGDALNSSYLSYCAVCADVPGYGQSALLRDWSQESSRVVLEVGEPFDWSASGTHVASLRKKDGTVSGPYVATRIDDYTLSIPSIDFTPETDWNEALDPPHVIFGPVDTWAYKVLVTSITPSGTSSAAVEAVGYDERVYQYDDAVEP